VGSGTRRDPRNEKADQLAKVALQRKTNKNYKTVAEDWKNYIREKHEGIRQAEWTSSDNPMVTVKPRRHSREETEDEKNKLETEDELHPTDPWLPGVP
jgi:hypothetical protein